MTEDHLNIKIKEYIERSRFWTDKAINQLGYSINLITTIGIGIFGYLISNSEKLKATCGSNLFYYISLFLLFLSITFGTLSIFSRLCDFRISRNLSQTRKKFLSKLKNEEGLINTKENLYKKQKFIIPFIKIVFGNINLISDEDLNSDIELKSKFERLQKQAFVLGMGTWKFHIIQIFFLLFSLLFLFLFISI